MDLSFVNILLALLTLAIAIAAFGEETYRKGNSFFLRRITLRGWILLTCLVVASVLSLCKEYAANEHSALQDSIIAHKDSLLAGQLDRIDSLQNHYSTALLNASDSILRASEAELKRLETITTAQNDNLSSLSLLSDSMTTHFQELSYGFDRSLAAQLELQRNLSRTLHPLKFDGLEIGYSITWNAQSVYLQSYFARVRQHILVEADSLHVTDPIRYGTPNNETIIFEWNSDSSKLIPTGVYLQEGSQLFPDRRLETEQHAFGFLSCCFSHISMSYYDSHDPTSGELRLSGCAIARDSYTEPANLPCADNSTIVLFFDFTGEPRIVQLVSTKDISKDWDSGGIRSTLDLFNGTTIIFVPSSQSVREGLPISVLNEFAMWFDDDGFSDVYFNIPTHLEEVYPHVEGWSFQLFDDNPCSSVGRGHYGVPPIPFTK